MTVLEIKEAAERYLGITLPEDEVLFIVNEGLARFGDLGVVHAEAEVQAEADVWYEMPEDLTSILQVRGPKGEIYLDYETRGSRIRFRHSGFFTVLARRMPEPVEAITDTPEVHPLLHRALVSYLRGWVKVRDDDESQDGFRLLEQADQEALRHYNTLMRRRWPHKIKVMRHA